MELKRVGYDFGHCGGWRGNPRCVYKERKDGQKQGEGAEMSPSPLRVSFQLAWPSQKKPSFPNFMPCHTATKPWVFLLIARQLKLLFKLGFKWLLHFLPSLVVPGVYP